MTPYPYMRREESLGTLGQGLQDGRALRELVAHLALVPKPLVASAHDEVTSAARDQLDGRAGEGALDFGSQPGRLWFVASHHAVFDFDLHAREVPRPGSPREATRQPVDALYRSAGPR